MRLGFLLSPPNPGAATAGSHGRPDSSPLCHLLPTHSKLQLGADRGFSSPSARSWRSRRRLSGRERGLPRCGRGHPQRGRERRRCSGRECGGRRGRYHGPARRHCSGRERRGHGRRRPTRNGLPRPAARHAGASPLPAIVGPPGSPLYPLPPGRRWRVPSPRCHHTRRRSGCCPPGGRGPGSRPCGRRRRSTPCGPAPYLRSGLTRPCLSRRRLGCHPR